MDFELSEEQQMLADSVERFGQDYYGFSAWRERTGRGGGASRALWGRMAELGWLALTIPEAQGGVGGGPVETLVVMEGFGRHLMLEPYVGSCVIAPALLVHAKGELAAELMAGIAAGSATVALADAEPQARYDGVIQTRAERRGDGFVLTGEKSHVLAGGEADWLIVPARTAGAAGDEAGVTLFLVPRGAEGLTVTASRAIDHRHNARLLLDGVAVSAISVIGEVDAGVPLLRHALDLAICARLSEAVGAMTAAYEKTLQYLQTRHQFGQQIGGFQVLQHRAVDMAMACEEARSMCCLATLSLDGEDADERRRTISAAKARVGQTSLLVGRQAVQLHGGIGFSDELDISHYLKRLIMIDMAFGNADHHRGVVARQLQAAHRGASPS